MSSAVEARLLAAATVPFARSTGRFRGARPRADGAHCQLIAVSVTWACVTALPVPVALRYAAESESAPRPSTPKEASASPAPGNLQRAALGGHHPALISKSGGSARHAEPLSRGQPRRDLPAGEDWQLAPERHAVEAGGRAADLLGEFAGIGVQGPIAQPTGARGHEGGFGYFVSFPPLWPSPLLTSTLTSTLRF